NILHFEVGVLQVGLDPYQTKLKGKQESLTVFFYIYGGAFIEGTSSYHLYRPDHFIEQNSILVTANYRLGMFGK
ncbi:unnamed protein product, partial [Callosobruchus maculatus]